MIKLLNRAMPDGAMSVRAANKLFVYGIGLFALYVATFFLFMDPKEPAVRGYQIAFDSSSRFAAWQFCRSSSGLTGRKFKEANFLNYVYYPLDFFCHLVQPNDKEAMSYLQFGY